jgi:spore coat polysaccharide biosynthesis protein SpsF (cytidylyltransferase family)
MPHASPAMDSLHGAHPPRTVAVIQARTGSTRLPGKVLELIADRSLLAWTVAGVRAIPGLATVVVATTTEARDDRLAEAAAALGVEVHRGPVRDVLTRCFEAVEPHEPDLVLRQTADNPFPDPTIAAAQVEALVADELDYVGIAGWPIGIAAEVCRMDALSAAMREATAAADREHVMPYLYSHPERFRIGALPRPIPVKAGGERWRYTVDTPADLELARAVAGRLRHGPPVQLAELEAIMLAEPALAQLNAAVVQKPWQVAQATEGR